MQYATTRDGARIAYTVSGSGPPLIFLPMGLNHVQLSWRYDRRIIGWLQALNERFRLVRYDSRGQGMSTRNLPPGLTVADLESDLEAVVEHSGLQRFILLGYLRFAHVAIKYATANAGQIEALILVSPSATTPQGITDFILGLAAHSWDLCLRNFVPAGFTRDQTEALVAYFRQTTSQADKMLETRAFEVSDVTALMPCLKVPVLIIHSRDYAWVNVEQVEQVAAAIPQAKLVIIDGDDNMPFGDQTQAIHAVDEFISGLGVSEKKQAPKEDDALSPRELEVLSLLTHGYTNRQIADELVISVNTAARHVASILAKTGASNRTEAALRARLARKPAL